MPDIGRTCARWLRFREMHDWTHATLKLTHCPACNYDIADLSRRSRCPECGFAYDEQMFMLEGWRLPGRGAWLRAAIIYGPIVVIGLGVLRFDFAWSVDVILALVAGAAAITTLAYVLAWRRDKSGGRVLTSYLITADGVARPGRRTVYMWRNYSHVMLMPAGEGWRLHLYPSWWRAVGPPVVNALLQCGEREAEAVRDEVQRRINAARRAESEERPPAVLPRRWW